MMATMMMLRMEDALRPAISVAEELLPLLAPPHHPVLAVLAVQHLLTLPIRPFLHLFPSLLVPVKLSLLQLLTNHIKHNSLHPLRFRLARQHHLSNNISR
jgi:hypothetical protein